MSAGLVIKDADPPYMGQAAKLDGDPEPAGEVSS